MFFSWNLLSIKLKALLLLGICEHLNSAFGFSATIGREINVRFSTVKEKQKEINSLISKNEE